MLGLWLDTLHPACVTWWKSPHVWNCTFDESSLERLKRVVATHSTLEEHHRSAKIYDERRTPWDSKLNEGLEPESEFLYWCTGSASIQVNCRSIWRLYERSVAQDVAHMAQFDFMKINVKRDKGRRLCLRKAQMRETPEWSSILEVDHSTRIINLSTKTNMIRGIYLKKEGGCSVGTSSIVAHE